MFVEDMSGVAHIRFLRGIVELVGGVLCLLALISTFAFLRPGFGAPYLFVLGFMILTSDGVVSLLKSRKIRRFK